LLTYIRKLNSQKLPASVYVPIDLLGKSSIIKESVLRICEDYAFCLSSKQRVPFHILIEALEIKDSMKNQTGISPFGLSNELKNDSDCEVNPMTDKIIESKPKKSKGFFSSLFCCCTSDSVQEEKIKSLFGEDRFHEVESKLLAKSPYTQYKNRRIISLIVKGLEDMRQDMFVSQVIQLFSSFFEKDNISIYMEAVSIISNGRGGIIQTFVNASSLDRIKKQNPFIESLKHYFITKFGGFNSKAYKNAVLSFLESLAGFSLVCYFLQIKDRHNGNILIDDEGRLIHIDFGFLLNHSPGNMNFEKAPFKLTR
jgi:Phosphatidylinositol 3- and 4-kinase